MTFPMRTLLSVSLAAALAGCSLAPTYERPDAPIDTAYPQGAAYKAAQPADPGGMATADIGWRDFFGDPLLQQLIEQSLANNRDLRVAALNVEYQRAQYRIQRAELFPAVSASAEGTRQRALSDGTTAVSSQYSVGLGVSSYELDLFGRLRNFMDAALEDYLALEQTRRSTQISLVAEVAGAWMTLAADQQLLKLASDTHASQQKTYELVQRSHGLGGESGLSLAQARSTVESARAEAASYASQVEQDRNALELLVGERLDANLLPGNTGLDAALLATDADNKIQPQMLEKWEVSPDGKTYTMTLRDGQKWHDGKPVTSEDCVASIKRWAAGDGMGRTLLKFTDKIEVIDDKNFR
ncbi:MAG: hypothetical protein E2603_22345, partial [Achromobacter sp.]|nr:hypothetical protein [Achromobacter sp.]